MSTYTTTDYCSVKIFFFFVYDFLKSISREQPPPCPQPGNPVVIEKHLPRVCLPRQSNSRFIFRNSILLFHLVIVEQCPPPPPKPQAIIYEKYLPPPPPPQRQVIVQRNACQSTVCTCACSSTTQQAPCRRLVREVIRQVPQQCTPAVVCSQQNQQKITPRQSQVVQQFVPVFAQRQVSFNKEKEKINLLSSSDFHEIKKELSH